MKLSKGGFGVSSLLILRMFEKTVLRGIYGLLRMECHKSGDNCEAVLDNILNPLPTQKKTTTTTKLRHTVG